MDLDKFNPMIPDEDDNYELDRDKSLGPDTQGGSQP